METAGVPGPPSVPIVPPSEETKAHFCSTPWAWKLFSDPNLRPFSNPSRIPNNSTTSCSFIGKTLATQDTIVAWQSFYKPPDSTSKYGQVLCLALLGSGVNGHVDTSHGGFVAVLFDEGFGLVAGNQRPDDRAVMTVSLKIDYKKPVPTPGVVLCRCWLEKEERRKMWIRGAIEDGDGTVLATAQSLFLVVEGLKPLERL